VRISVAVTTRNRARRLERLFAALREQTLDPAQFEVVVVDDGSEDDTPAVLAHAAAQAGLQLRSIRRATSGGPGAGRNAGWRATTAPLIAFTDDDCEPQPGWLEALLAAHERDPEAFVQGPVEPHPGERRENELFTRTIRVASLGPWFQTANIAYPRALLERLGGFDERFSVMGEDTDVAWRAIGSGARPVFAPDARVFHAVNPHPPLAQLRMVIAWSAAVQVVKAHPELRAQVYRRVFWKRPHALLLLAALGLAGARRFPPLALLALPYARSALERRQGAPRPLAAWVALRDAVEVAATLRGSLQYGALLI
jgi:GT2 family glycosyltransferase